MAAIPLGTVLVVAKEPVPGRVKTRLVPPLTHEQAAGVATAMLVDTLAEALTWPAHEHVLLLDGRRPDVVPPDYRVLPQVSGGLDERLAAGFDASRGPVLLVGMDTPQLSRDLLGGVLDGSVWQQHDAALGLARDGGFWALALAEPDGGLVRGVPMSSPDTGRCQLDRLRGAGLRVALLPELTDVDSAAEADEVAAAAPGTRFATAWWACPPERVVDR